MRNITINIPDIYDKNLLKLQKLGMIPSRSEGVRLAIRNFLQNEYKNLKILGYYEE
ncbi:MAG: CopG family transcriptional regulator [Candidatus Lokiarchaeota archaeon]|nr:CopG family transcriptional regulator [Candidatus Lokiarchaeota archaeon]